MFYKNIFPFHTSPYQTEISNNPTIQTPNTLSTLMLEVQHVYEERKSETEWVQELAQEGKNNQSDEICREEGPSVVHEISDNTQTSDNNGVDKDIDNTPEPIFEPAPTPST